jgi:transcriptional regulator with PAS, ATPase and Fis domain
MLTGLSGQSCYIMNVQNIEAILDLFHDGIIIVDKECIISSFNKRYRENSKKEYDIECA